MQDPWVTGKNYALGCTYLNGDPAVLSEYQGYANPGYASDGSVVFDSAVNGERIPSECRALRADEPESLYEYQFNSRISSGNLISNYVGE